MQVNNIGVQPVAGQKQGAVADKTRSVGADGTITFSKSISLPHGRTMTMERVWSHGEGGVSMHMEKLLPNGKNLVIDVTKTNAEVLDPAPATPEPEAPTEPEVSVQPEAPTTI